MPTAAPAGRTSAQTVLLALFVLSPILVPALVVIGALVVFLVLMVVQAFGQGLPAGCVALGTLIGLPWLGFTWVRAAIRLYGPAPGPGPDSMPGLADTEARYRAGDFIHRDYEAERRAERECRG